MSENTDTPAGEALPKTLYHYYGVNAFHGIVTSKQLWLSNAAFTNDYMEHKWLIDKARERIRERSKTSAHSARLEQLADALDSDNAPHIFCLSSAGDLLSQWRAYSDDGAGIAVGFSGQALKSGIRKYVNEPWFLLEFRKVEYDEKSQNAIIDNLVQIYEKEQIAADEADLRAILAASKIKLFAAICKNPGFSEESEWRIGLMINSDPDEPCPGMSDEHANGPSAIAFRVSGSQIVPFFTLPFTPEAITDICLGPKNYARENRKHLEMFMLKNGYDVGHITIVNSAATYR